MLVYLSEKYYMFYALALLAEILGTVSGFGSSILFVPLAAFFFDFHEVLGITALFHVFSNISKIFLFRKGMDRSIVQFMGLPAVGFVLLGALLSRFAPVKELELMLSVFMVVVSTLLLTGYQDRIQASRKNLLIGGSLSGFVAGLIGTGGAIRGITLSAFNIGKESFISTSAAIDFGVDGSRLLVYLYNGFVRKEFLTMIPLLILISIAGTWGGKFILSFLSEKTFRRIVLGLILSLALFQIIQYALRY